MKISIVTPVYNRADCLQRCIDSVLLQSYPDWEFLLVDDGSSDDTWKLIEKNIEADCRIRGSRLPVNRGPNAARNHAIRQATGDFCLFLDSDDHLRKDVLRKIVEFAEQKPGCRYFFFAVSDRIDYYEKVLGVLCGEKRQLTYQDWLLNKISGDFVHMPARDVAQKYPFNEQIRINEFLTFLDFYREAEYGIFLHLVVTERERNRRDAVTRESSFGNIEAIRRKKTANDLLLKRFGVDMLTYGGSVRYIKACRDLYLYSLLTSDYSLAYSAEDLAAARKQKLPIIFRCICKCHAGYLFFLIIRAYSTLKDYFRFYKDNSK